MSHLKLILLGFFFIFSNRNYGQELVGVISKVTDGDSFEFLSPEGIRKIRLHGIDCPEINQPYGDSARIFLSYFLQDTVSIIIRDIDRYGRSVADVFYLDTSINYKLLEKGLAWHYKKYSADSLYSETELIAKANHLGLWQETNPISPWDWRAGKFDHSVLTRDPSLKFFICVGKENATFHTIHYCEELKTCISTTILVRMNEAIEVYGKTACSKCIHSTN